MLIAYLGTYLRTLRDGELHTWALELVQGDRGLGTQGQAGRKINTAQVQAGLEGKGEKQTTLRSLGMGYHLEDAVPTMNVYMDRRRQGGWVSEASSVFPCQCGSQ